MLDKYCDLIGHDLKKKALHEVFKYFIDVLFGSQYVHRCDVKYFQIVGIDQRSRGTVASHSV